MSHTSSPSQLHLSPLQHNAFIRVLQAHRLIICKSSSFTLQSINKKIFLGVVLNKQKVQKNPLNTLHLHFNRFHDYLSWPSTEPILVLAYLAQFGEKSRLLIVCAVFSVCSEVFSLAFHSPFSPDSKCILYLLKSNNFILQCTVFRLQR